MKSRSECKGISREYPSLYKLMSAFVIMVFIMRFTIASIHPFGETSTFWGIYEFMINLEGGYVRRGIPGEVLFWFCGISGLRPGMIVIVFCYVVYAGVFAFMWALFRKKGYCWWLLLSPLMLGLCMDIVRKDFLLLGLVLVSLHLVRNDGGEIWRRLAIFLIWASGVLVHEAFFFFGVPLPALFLCARKRHRVLSVVSICVVALLFVIQCLYKGDMECAERIIESWNNLYPDLGIVYESQSAIGAIGWSTGDTVRFHLKENFFFDSNLVGFFVRPFYCLMIYYFLTNFLFVVRKNYGGVPLAKSGQEFHRKSLSVYIVISLICLIPMFLFLSCDYPRVYMYLSVTSVGAWLMLGDRIIDLVPERCVDGVARFNALLDRIVVPTKGIMTLMLLLVAENFNSYILTRAFEGSMVGGFMKDVSYVLYMMKSAIGQCIIAI